MTSLQQEPAWKRLVEEIRAQRQATPIASAVVSNDDSHRRYVPSIATVCAGHPDVSNDGYSPASSHFESLGEGHEHIHYNNATDRHAGAAFTHQDASEHSPQSQPSPSAHSATNTATTNKQGSSSERKLKVSSFDLEKIFEKLHDSSPRASSHGQSFTATESRASKRADSAREMSRHTPQAKISRMKPPQSESGKGGDVNGKNYDLRALNRALQDQLTDTKKRETLLHQRMKKLEAENSQIKLQLSAAERSTATWSQTANGFAQREAQWSEKERTLLDSIDEYKRKISEYHQAMREFVQISSEEKSALAHVQAKLDSSQEDIDKLQQHLAQSQKQLQDAHELQATTKAALMQLEVERAHSDKLLEDSQNECGKLQQALKAVMAKERQVEQRSHRVRDSVRKQKEMAETAQRDVEVLQQRVNHLSQERRTLLSTVRSLRAALSEARQTIRSQSLRLEREKERERESGERETPQQGRRRPSSESGGTIQPVTPGNRHTPLPPPGMPPLPPHVRSLPSVTGGYSPSYGGETSVALYEEDEASLQGDPANEEDEGNDGPATGRSLRSLGTVSSLSEDRERLAGVEAQSLDELLAFLSENDGVSDLDLADRLYQKLAALPHL